MRAKKGFKLTKEHKKKLSKSKLGNKNPNWKGRKVQYAALHNWIRKNYKRPKYCEICNKAKSYEVANLGKYDRNFKNWKWVCRKCHMRSDGRLEHFYKVAKSKVRKNCIICGKQMLIHKNREKVVKTCSYKCRDKYNKLNKKYG